MNANLNSLTSEDFSFYSDMYKDAHGFRPSSFPFNTVEEYKEIVKSLSEEVSRQIDEEELQEKIMIEKLEETIRDTMKTCNCSWKRAFEILMEDEEDVYSDIDYFLHNWGIFGSKAYEIINKYNES